MSSVSGSTRFAFGFAFGFALVVVIRGSFVVGCLIGRSVDWPRSSTTAAAAAAASATSAATAATIIHITSVHWALGAGWYLHVHMQHKTLNNQIKGQGTTTTTKMTKTTNTTRTTRTQDEDEGWGQ